MSARLTARQVELLHAVDRGEARWQYLDGLFEAYLDTTGRTVTAAVARLDARSLVTRAHPERRSGKYELTDAGRDALRREAAPEVPPSPPRRAEDSRR